MVRKYQSQVVRNTVKSFGEIQLTMFGKHNKRKKQMRNCVIYSWPTVDQLLDIWGKVCDDVSDAVCGNVCGDVWLCMTMYGVICYNICHNNVCGDVLYMWLCMAIYGSAIWEQQEKALYWVYRRKGACGIYCNFQHPLFLHFLFSEKSPNVGKRKNLIQYHIALPVPKPACLQDSHPRMATMMRLEKCRRIKLKNTLSPIWVRGCLSSLIVEI